MKDKKVKNTLEKYRVPQIPNSLIDNTVGLAKRAFERTGIKYEMSFREILVGQIKYISPSLWVIQAALLFIILVFLLVSNSTHNAYQSVITTISVASPIIALVVIPELAKSFNHHVWEMESTCKFDLQKLLAIRLIIIGALDMFVITIMVVITSTFYELSFINISLYILVPFNMASSIYLYILRRIRGKAATIICLTVGIFMALGVGLLAVYSELYTLISTFIWMTMFIFSTVVLVYELIHMLKSLQEGEKLEWNLP
ncbi:hypothetical protein JFL43_16960 [Viridibacillus sp. YIM B01967]|uniref:Uncharacterized protein n=1 Tax=Viridibacillus soli TaxID=2798301 RepID=A0ABS1HAP8_9BACL|nr:hypothetical protein [Viridibacillus soli]MBK3496516.1 hypothetical protein [Viridibacillus soli]